jgi:transposase
MPKRDVILNLPGFTVVSVRGYDPVIFELKYRRKARRAYCNGRELRKKSSFIRQVRHETIGHRKTILRFKAYKFYCKACCRYFNQQFPGIPKYQRATERLHKQVFFQHTEGISQKDLSKNFKVSTTTIERWFHRCYEREYQEFRHYRCPSVLGIDEHSFNKKTGYVTTLCDLRKHRIFDVVKGKSGYDLTDYFNRLEGKENVKVVCMDFSSSYRQLIQRYFPKAIIVSDRFHVIRLLQRQCMQTYQEIDPEMKYQRGLIRALRTNPENLNTKQLARRNAYFEKQPAIAAIYEFKQRLYRVLMKKTMTAKRCKKYIPIFLKMLKALKESIFKPLVTLGKTLTQWKEAIVCMWRFTKNNGITEGFHRKMKLIQRRAYGFRNFENYRLRVKVLCA